MNFQKSNKISSNKGDQVIECSSIVFIFSKCVISEFTCGYRSKQQASCSNTTHRFWHTQEEGELVCSKIFKINEEIKISTKQTQAQ